MSCFIHFLRMSGLVPVTRLGRGVLLVGLAGLLASGSTLAQDSTLTRFIRKNTLPMAAGGAAFSGTGWENLRQDVARSQFVLLGEMHGTVQIPQLAAALALGAAPPGFRGRNQPLRSPGPEPAGGARPCSATSCKWPTPA